MTNWYFMRTYLLPLAMLFFAACTGEAPEKQSPVGPATPGEERIGQGKVLFQQNCRTCHIPHRDMAGPALTGALARWDNDSARIRAFIRNPAQMISQGDPRAVAVFEAYKPTVMTAFPHLSDEDLDLIIGYFENANEP